MSSPADHDPETVLARWWQSHTATDEDDDQLDTDEGLAGTASLGQTWPGPAQVPMRRPISTRSASWPSIRAPA
jgi:hypothetical protein